MARIRNIKPAFFKDEQLAEHPPLTRILFEGLWTLADKHGRLEDRPKYIKVEVLPYDKCDIDAMLAALATSRFITRYTVDGRAYIEVRTFTKHQRISGAEAKAPTTIPAPSVTQESSNDTANETPRGSAEEAPEKHVSAQGGITEYGVQEGSTGRDSGHAPPASPAPPPEPIPVPRDAWLSLVDAWNSVAAAEPSWSAVGTNLQRLSQARLLRALQVLPDLAAWEARFKRAAASDHLTNRNGKGFVATLWWVLDHVDELDAATYDNRVVQPRRVQAIADDDWVPPGHPDRAAYEARKRGVA